jgi:hypothetical protein
VTIMSITKIMCERYLATVVTMYMMLIRRKNERGSVRMEDSDGID